VTSRHGARALVPRQKSRSVAEATDPRAEKTRGLISAAFLALINRRPYERIRVSDITRKAGVGRVVLPMLVELPGDPCLVDCTNLFAHVQQAREIYRSLMAGTARVGNERMLQDAIEARIASALVVPSAQAKAAAPTPGFLPRFVAGTILTLIAWSLEQAVAPPPSDLQNAYRALVGHVLQGTARA